MKSTLRVFFVDAVQVRYPSNEAGRYEYAQKLSIDDDERHHITRDALGVTVAMPDSDWIVFVPFHGVRRIVSTLHDSMPRALS